MKWTAYHFEAPRGFVVEVSHRCGTWIFPICYAEAFVTCPPMLALVGAFQLVRDPTRENHAAERQAMGILNLEAGIPICLDLVPAPVHARS